MNSDTPPQDDGLWYKDAVVYQLHVKSFFDSNEDVYKRQQVGHAQDGGVAPLPQVGQDLAVAGLDEAQRAAAEGMGLAALRQHAAGPVQQ